MDLEQLRSDPRLSDPFMTPDWRYQRVLKMISREPVPGRPTRLDDNYITDLRAFLLRWRRGDAEQNKLLVEETALHHAWRIFDNLMTDQRFKFATEARLLSGQTPTEIAFAVKTLPEVMVYFEKLFFNVAPFLEHHDWVVKHALLPPVLQTAESNEDEFVSFSTPAIVKPYEDMSIKYFAYFGGPIICEYMLNKFQSGKRCPTADEMGAWFDATHTIAIQSKSAQATGVFEVNKYNVMELFATHARIMEIQKSNGGDSEKQNEIEKHIKAMLSQIPWTSGKDGRTRFEGSIIGEVDKGASEMNAEELMLAGAGLNVASLPTISGLKINR